MSVANILSMAGGLGLFLFGIRTMGDGLENAAGAKLKRMLEVLTGNRFLAVLVGFVVTAIIQSSTATTVMVVGFVNAGMMSLAQAVGVIMGANIGTTVTSLLIALNFSSVAAAAVLVGVILMLASKKTVVKNLGAIFTGFGLLFLGIDMMSDSMAPLRESAGFMNFIVTVSESPLRPLFGIILGIVMTAVLQSSSASVGVLQTLAMQGLVPLKFPFSSSSVRISEPASRRSSRPSVRRKTRSVPQLSTCSSILSARVYSFLSPCSLPMSSG